jgi:hypothetical protein
MQVVAHGAVQPMQQLVARGMLEDTVRALRRGLTARQQQPVHRAATERVCVDHDLAGLRGRADPQLELLGGRGVAAR